MQDTCPQGALPTPLFTLGRSWPLPWCLSQPNSNSCWASLSMGWAWSLGVSEKALLSTTWMRISNGIMISRNLAPAPVSLWQRSLCRIVLRGLCGVSVWVSIRGLCVGSLCGVSIRAMCGGPWRTMLGWEWDTRRGAPSRLHPPSGHIPSSRGWEKPHLRASCPSGLWGKQDQEPGQSFGL